MTCRNCGHPNKRGATTCARCHKPMDAGIRRGFHCPRCGQPNGAGSIECRGCGYQLRPIEALPESQRPVVCPDCRARNPQVADDAVAFCLGCGRRLYGSGQVVGSVMRASPAPVQEELTLAQIDQALAGWQGRLREVDAALDRLRAGPNEQTAPTLDRLGRGRDALAAAVERGRRLRSGVRWFWPSEEKLQDLTALLTGPSILLPATDAVSDPRRVAPGAAPVRVTLDELDRLLRAGLESSGASQSRKG